MDKPCLFDVPVGSHLNGFRVIEHFFGLQQQVIVSGVPFSVPVAVVEKPDVVFSWFQVEEVRASVLCRCLVQHFVVLLHELYHGCGIGIGKEQEECAKFFVFRDGEVETQGEGGEARESCGSCGVHLKPVSLSRSPIAEDLVREQVGFVGKHQTGCGDFQAVLQEVEVEGCRVQSLKGFFESEGEVFVGC